MLRDALIHCDVESYSTSRFDPGETGLLVKSSINGIRGKKCPLPCHAANVQLWFSVFRLCGSRGARAQETARELSLLYDDVEVLRHFENLPASVKANLPH